MTKAKLILIAAFVVTLAAGVVAGYTLRSLCHHAPKAVSGGGPAPARETGATSLHNLFLELKLTPAQKAKMDEIWDGVVRAARKLHEEQRQAFQKRRDEAIRAILTEEQKARFDEVLKDYDSKKPERDKERDMAREKLFQEAVEKTKLILNAEQRTKYEAWLKSRHEERHPGGAPPPAKVEEHTAAGSGS